MSKNTIAKDNTARPPYKIKSAGTKWGIPPDSPEDSTSVPARASSMTEEQSVELKVKISRLESVENDIPDNVGDELLPRAASEGGAGDSAAEPTIRRGKKPLQKAKSMPVKATERGSRHSQLEVGEQGCEIITTCDFHSDGG